MLRVALPNGSLEEETVKFFEKADIGFTRTARRYRSETNDSRIADVVFMRPHIIPYVVGKGLYDLGITGSDLLAEAGDCQSVTIAKLGYSRAPEHEWRLVLLAGEENPVMRLADIEDDAIILSEYPRTTREALERVGKRARIQFSHGSTEAHVPDDFPYGVCIASRNVTLKANHLKIVHVLSVETAVLIGGPKRTETRERESAAMSLIRDLLQ